MPTGSTIEYDTLRIYITNLAERIKLEDYYFHDLYDEFITGKVRAELRPKEEDQELNIDSDKLSALLFAE